jgi:ATP-dependent Clp protease ATP-binding subunit ClpA
MPPSQKARDLHKAVDLLDDAIALVRKALNHNPSDSERRDLEQILLRLESERGVLQAEFDSALEEDTEVQAPSTTQIATVADLSDKVAQATQQANLSSEAIALGGKVFDLATSIVTHG